MEKILDEINLFTGYSWKMKKENVLYKIIGENVTTNYMTSNEMFTYLTGMLDGIKVYRNAVK